MLVPGYVGYAWFEDATLGILDISPHCSAIFYIRRTHTHTHTHYLNLPSVSHTWTSAILYLLSTVPDEEITHGNVTWTSPGHFQRSPVTLLNKRTDCWDPRRQELNNIVSSRRSFASTSAATLSPNWLIDSLFWDEEIGHRDRFDFAKTCFGKQRVLQIRKF